MLKIEEIYIYEFILSTFDTGEKYLIKPSSILKHQQEAGERHLAKIGLNHQGLMRAGMFFVLLRTSVKINKTPKTGDEIKLSTYHGRTRGAFMQREYTWFCENGTPLIESISSFALLSADTRKILRPAEFFKLVKCGEPAFHNSCPEPQKISLPAGMEDGGLREVRYSDIDMNRHMGNTVYADIITDCLPKYRQGSESAGFTLCYEGEIRQGESLCLKKSEDCDKMYISGQCADKRCFSAVYHFR